MKYLERYKFVLSINIDLDKSVIFFESFYKVNGAAWVVTAKYDQNNLDDSDEMSFVISDENSKVEYVMDHMGIPYSYHLTNDYDFTEDDIKEILEDD